MSRVFHPSAFVYNAHRDRVASDLDRDGNVVHTAVDALADHTSNVVALAFDWDRLCLVADLVATCDDVPVPLACVLAAACHIHRASEACVDLLPAFRDAVASHLEAVVDVVAIDHLLHWGTLHLCAPSGHHHCNHLPVDSIETVAMSCLCHFVPVAAAVAVA